METFYKIKGFIKKIIPWPVLSFYHFILAFLGALVYGSPSRKMKVIGVTGTSGKTTVTELIAKILEEAGYKVALLNSVRFKIREKEWQNTLRMTMPGRFFIQKFLRQALNNGCQYAVLEITSEGIKQHRHRFINFNTAVFTNLSPEHIETHGNFENYRAAKGKLFQATKNIHIINLNDENAEYFLQFPAREKWGYKFKMQNAKCKMQNLKILEFDEKDFNLNLTGEFNLYNAAAATCVGLSQGIDLESCKKTLEKIEGIPGRMELVISEPFKVFVDYAITPNALEKVYQTIGNWKAEIGNSRMICVLGACGGGRDKWKRPVLGGLAAKYCDKVIITNEDPYDENPLQIIEQIESGFSKIPNSKLQTPNSCYKILNRREAIKKALSLAKPNDIVVITGKGCEPCIIEKDKKIPWDDRKVVREEFNKLQNKTCNL